MSILCLIAFAWCFFSAFLVYLPHTAFCLYFCGISIIIVIFIERGCGCGEGDVIVLMCNLACLKGSVVCS